MVAGSSAKRGSFRGVPPAAVPMPLAAKSFSRIQVNDCSYGTSSDAHTVTNSAPADGTGKPGAPEATGQPKKARARKPAPAVPLAVRTRAQIAQEEHLRRMQLRSG